LAQAAALPPVPEMLAKRPDRGSHDRTLAGRTLRRHYPGRNRRPSKARPMPVPGNRETRGPR
jgi:hypothetical protein